MGSKLSFGSDPEFMLTQDGKYISAISVIDADITSRIQVQGHEFYWDNVMAECAIKPSFSRKETIDNFRECFSIYNDIVKPHRLTIQASQDFPESELIDDRSKIAGCLPDKCAYTFMDMRPPREIIEETPFRTCGGHVHIGNPIFQSERWESIIAVRLLDLFLGIPALFIEKDPTAPKRRTLYGQAGRFRVKDYGLEYRSLSNFWLASPKTVGFVYDIVEFLVNFMDKRKFEDFYDFNEDIYYQAKEGPELQKAYTSRLYDDRDIQKCLDTNDLDQAERYGNIATSLFPEHINICLMELQNQKKPFDFYTEWGIN